MPFTLSEPHPDFGKDPNIKNELGHTEYPKYVDHPTETVPHAAMPKKLIPLRVLVKDAEEEAEVLGTKVEKAAGWNKDKH